MKFFVNIYTNLFILLFNIVSHTPFSHAPLYPNYLSTKLKKLELHNSLFCGDCDRMTEPSKFLFLSLWSAFCVNHASKRYE